MLRSGSKYDGLAASKFDLISSAGKIKESKSPCTIGCQKRSKSAQRVFKRARKAQISFPKSTCQLHEHHHGKQPSLVLSSNQYPDESPNRLDRSVTFNDQVKVREFDSAKNSRRMSGFNEERKSITSTSPRTAYCNVHSREYQSPFKLTQSSPLRSSPRRESLNYPPASEFINNSTFLSPI